MTTQQMRLKGLAAALAGFLVVPGLVLGQGIGVPETEGIESTALAKVSVSGVCVSIACIHPCLLSNNNFGCASTLLRGQERAQDTAFATLQPGEPQPACAPISKTVWFKMVAYGLPVEFPDIHLSTSGSSFDTVLAVYSGSDLSNLQLWRCDDDSGPSLTSEVEFTTGAGATFYIQVGSYSSTPGGQLRLLWT